MKSFKTCENNKLNTICIDVLSNENSLEYLSPVNQYFVNVWNWLVFLLGNITTTDGYNSTHNDIDNSTLPSSHMSAIFLQTVAAQGIAGVFAFASLLLTSYHVC